MAPRWEKGVISFEEHGLWVPEEVVLDTCFVVDALLPNETRHQECADFLARLTGQPSTLFFNRLLEMELAEAVFKATLKDKAHVGGWRKARLDGRKRRPASRLVREVSRAWAAVLRQVPHGVVELGHVMDLVPDYMSTGLRSGDAVHAATADHLGVPIIVTTDYDFALLPVVDATLCVPSKMVARFRAERVA